MGINGKHARLVKRCACAVLAAVVLAACLVPAPEKVEASQGLKNPDLRKAWMAVYEGMKDRERSIHFRSNRLISYEDLLACAIDYEGKGKMGFYVFREGTTGYRESYTQNSNGKYDYTIRPSYFYGDAKAGHVLGNVQHDCERKRRRLPV